MVVDFENADVMVVSLNVCLSGQFEAEEQLL